MNTCRWPAAGLSRRGVLGLGLASLAAHAALPGRAGAAEAATGVDAAAQAFISDHVAPGVQAAIFRKGAPVLSKGWGFANLETGTPVDPRSVFHIGSITKQFTAAQLLLLAEAGKLSVDDRLARFIPDFPRANEISLRQMLSHTSGLGNYTATKTRDIFYRRARVDYTSAELLEAMKGTDPLYIAEPGTRWAYSNTAFVLLGLVVEKVSGVPYAQAVREGVIARAGLKRTGVDDLSEVVPGRASGYTPDDKAASGYDRAAYLSMTYPGGAGDLRSTCEDLCLWHHALLSGRVVSAASLKDMTTPQRLSNGRLPLELQAPGAKTPPKPVEYGFGLELGRDEHGPFVAHAGGIFGFLSNLKTWRESGVSLARIINGDGGTSADKVMPDFNALDQAMTKAAFA